jgi:hypothetical protein
MKAHFSLAATVAACLLAPLAQSAPNVSPAAGPGLSPNRAMPEGFIMINGLTYSVHNGVATPLQAPVVMRITPNGIVGFDDVPRMITNNAMLTLDGRVVAAPDRLLAPPPLLLTQFATADNRLAPGNVAWGNSLSGLAPNRDMTAAPGPRFVSTKKKIIPKSRATVAHKTATTTTTKKASTAVNLPPFNDAVLQLPEDGLQPVAPPSIDATDTMLYMTAGGEPGWTPISDTGDTAPKVKGALRPDVELRSAAGVEPISTDAAPPAPAPAGNDDDRKQ